MYTQYQKNWHSNAWRTDPDYRFRRALARKKSYYKNKVDILLKLANKQRQRRELIDGLKHKPCMDCQGWFEPCQMDFDHREPANKVEGIGIMKGHWNLKRIFDEIAKCDLVCSNCHRLRTQRQQSLL